MHLLQSSSPDVASLSGPLRFQPFDSNFKRAFIVQALVAQALVANRFHQVESCVIKDRLSGKMSWPADRKHPKKGSQTATSAL